MSLIYVPALKAKKGELSALEQLTTDVKEKIVPIFEIPNIDWNYTEDQPAKTLESHLQDVVGAIAKHWQQKFFLDFSTGLQIAAAEQNAALLSIFDSIAKDKNLSYIPVIDFDRNTDITYRETTQAIHKRANLGICLRIKYDDLEDVIDQVKFNEFLENLSLPINDIDLVLDFDSITKYESEKTIYLATRLILDSIPQINSWRNVVVLSSSFPFTLSDIHAKSTQRLPRKEWLAWQKLFEKKERIKRLPTFGDYSISHPNLVEIDPRVMSMSASIRYSSENEWLILKGESIKLKGFSQFPELSEKLVSLPDFSGEKFSQGDKEIYDYAKGNTKGTGNTTTWRKIGNNHHITLVVNQLSNLLEPSK